MIRIKIKTSNDHCSMTSSFETIDLVLSTDDPHLKSMIDQSIKDFNQPVDEVIVSTRMEV